jgi:protein gp37
MRRIATGALEVGKVTGIEWCDHTYNPWIGCTKVSPACDHCYAEAQEEREACPLHGAGSPA